MAYSTLDDITIAAGGSARLVQISDQDQNGSADPTVIAKAQRDADAEIDEFTSLRFAQLIGTDLLPIETASAIAADHAVYLMKKWIGQLGPDDQTDLTARILRLQQLSNGERRPAEEVPGPSSAVKSAWVSRSEPGTDGECVRKRGPF